MGAENVTVHNLTVKNTLADGLHFNACYGGIHVDTVYGINTGDDTLAFVTYYDPTDPGPATGPFNSPDHTTRNDNGAVAAHIYSSGGLADGVRIAGGYNISVSDIHVDHKPNAGVVIDAALANGTSVTWTYLASRGIHIDGLTATANNVGFLIDTLNTPTGNTDYNTFDVTAQNLTLQNSTAQSILLSSVSGVALSSVTCGGALGTLMNGVQNISLTNSSFMNENLVVTGSVSSYTGDLDAIMPWHNVQVASVTVQGATILFQDLRGLTINHLTTMNAPQHGIDFIRVLDSTATSVHVTDANRSHVTAYPIAGLLLAPARRVTVSGYMLVNDTTSVNTVQVGGGVAGPSGISTAVSVLNSAYELTTCEGSLSPLLQTGPYAPQNVQLDIQQHLAPACVPPAPNLTVTPSTTVFIVTNPGRDPSSQTFHLTNTGSANSSWLATSDAAWLTVGPHSGTVLAQTGSQLLSVSAAIGSFTIGTYTGHLKFTDQFGIVIISTITAIIPSLSLSVTPMSPDLSGLGNKTFTLDDEISIPYSGTVTGFNWVFDLQPPGDTIAVPAAMRLLPQGSSAPIFTSAPHLSLRNLGLTTGTYLVRVQAVNGSLASAWISAQITIAASSLSGIRVYPNPFRASRGDHQMTFTGMPAGSAVKIFTVSARLVTTLSAPSGSITWDMTTDSGEKVASGIYLYLITDSAGDRANGKFTVIR
jgi:hypothetical protein